MAIDTPNPDDAFHYIVESLRRSPDGYKSDDGVTYDVWLPSLVWSFLRTAGYSPNRQGEFQRDPTETLWRSFYDAAWRLCRMSVLRPTVSWSAHTGIGTPAAGDGYSYTSQGRSWIHSSDLLFVPGDPGRYVALLATEAKRLGQGFAQRAHEAAACHQTGNYLACCAMCGAAAESAVLRTAVAKSGNEAKVLREYGKSNGRRLVLEGLFGSAPSELTKRFIGSAFNLLAHWRDETAHGQVSQVAEIEAYHSLVTLLRLAQFLTTNWTTLTGESE